MISHGLIQHYRFVSTDVELFKRVISPGLGIKLPQGVDDRCTSSWAGWHCIMQRAVPSEAIALRLAQGYMLHPGPTPQATQMLCEAAE